MGADFREDMGGPSPESDKSGLFLSDFGDGVAESWEVPSSESDRNGLILSDFEEVGVGKCRSGGWAAGLGSWDRNTWGNEACRPCGLSA